MSNTFMGVLLLIVWALFLFFFPQPWKDLIVYGLVGYYVGKLIAKFVLGNM